MRRTELIGNIENYCAVLVQTKIQQEVSNLVKTIHTEKVGAERIESFYAALKAYIIASIKFTPEIKEIEKVFGLSVLHSNNIMSLFLDGKPAASKMETVYNINQGFYWVTSFLPKFVTFLKTDYEKLPADDRKAILKGKEILSVIVIENDDSMSTIERYQKIFDSINLLYDSCCIIENEHQTKLVLLSCDSGSDKLFDFLGSDKVVKCLKDLLLSLWDRIVFFRERQISQRLDLILSSLPILERISELENGKVISPEQAGILKKNIIIGVNKFIDTGSIIPEITASSSYNPRELMAPEPKLLTGPMEIKPSKEGKRIKRSKVKVD